MENNKNKKSVKFQGDMLNFCDFIQVFVFTRNHHLNLFRGKWVHLQVLPASFTNRTTVDSRYLEIEGTLKNSSRYPNFDISDL